MNQAHVFASAMQAVSALFLLFGTMTITGQRPAPRQAPAKSRDSNDSTVAYFMMRGF